MNIWTCRLLVAVWALTSDSSCSNIPFSTPDTHLTAQEGSCIKINCTVNIDVDKEAQWFWLKNAWYNETAKRFDGTTIYSYKTPERHVILDIKTRVEYISGDSGKPQCGIIISNLQKTDSGNYSFRYIGKNGVNTWKTEPNVNLTVQENPCLVVLDTPPVMKESESVTLKCFTSRSCHSYPQFTGLNPQDKVVQRQQDNELIITVSFMLNWQHDGKVLSCQPEGNMDTCLARSLTLNVTYSPKQTSAVSSSADVKEGDRVTLTCSSRGNPPTSFSWYKDGQQISSYKEYIIYDIETSHSGKYHCEAKNAVGTEKSKELNINVKYPPVVSIQAGPRTAVEGDNITLTCTLTRSNPTPSSYSWYRNSEAIRLKELQKLDLINIKPENSGSYECSASNTVGTGTSPPHQLEVQYKPRHTVISSSISSKQVKINNSITLTCTADARPMPLMYYWYRCSEHVSSSPWNAKTTNQNSLCLQTAERTDDGCYVCSATNTIGKGENSSSLCIQVLYAPTKPVLSVVPEAREGDLITIDCTVESFPLSELTLTWTPETNPHSSPQQLAQSGYGSRRLNSFHVSFNVTSNSAGLYTCHAWNSEGFSNTVKELVVKYSPKDVTAQAKPNVVMIENGELVLNCLARSNPPATSYTWMKTTAGKVEVVGHVDTFTVKSLTPSHSGLYTCEVSNGIGTGKSAEVEVKVKYAPKHTEVTQMSSSQFGSSGPVVLSCSSLSFPPVNLYRWFRTTDQVPETFFSENQSITVQPHQPGAYYCVASNEIAGKRSATVNVFFYRSFMQVLPFIIGFLIVLTAISLIFLVYRHKRNKSKQGTSNTLSCWGCFGFLSRRNGTRENLVSDSGLADPGRSRDDLVPGHPYRPGPQPCRPFPDSTSASNIKTVYCKVNYPVPMGTQGRSPRAQDEHTEDGAVNYASLNFGDKKKQRWDPKAKADEDGLYARVVKPSPREKGELDVYENIRGAHAPKQTNSDTENSEEEIELNYSVVSFQAKPGQQRAHRRHNSDSDEEDYKTQYSRVNL